MQQQRQVRFQNKMTALRISGVGLNGPIDHHEGDVFRGFHDVDIVSDALALVNYLAAGEVTFDYKGNACGTFNQDGSDIPVGASPSQLSTSTNVGKLLDYDPATGTGDLSFTAYSGGNCQGAAFDGTGATIVSTGTGHFAVSGGGNRVDGIFTSLTGPSGGFGGFSLSFVYLKQ